MMTQFVSDTRQSPTGATPGHRNRGVAVTAVTSLATAAVGTAHAEQAGHLLRLMVPAGSRSFTLIGATCADGRSVPSRCVDITDAMPQSSGWLDTDVVVAAAPSGCGETADPTLTVAATGSVPADGGSEYRVDLTT